MAAMQSSIRKTGDFHSWYDSLVVQRRLAVRVGVRLVLEVSVYVRLRGEAVVTASLRQRTRKNMYASIKTVASCGGVLIIYAGTDSKVLLILSRGQKAGALSYIRKDHCGYIVLAVFSYILI
jgi:hypothetical protein